jgi:hypothetical protein
VVASKCYQDHFISDKYKEHNNLTYISFKMVPFCNYTLLPATVDVLETFLEAVLCKPFQLFRRILNCQKHHKGSVHAMLISVEGTGQNQLQLGHEGMGDAPVLSHCSLLRNL